MIGFAIDKAFKNYFNFSGRSNRSEFWYFFLFILLANALTHFIDTWILGYHSEEMGLITGIFYLCTFIPQLSIIVRRLHDTGKSGWLYLLVLIPYIGSLIIFIFTVIQGDKEDNKYGPDPKA